MYYFENETFEQELQSLAKVWNVLKDFPVAV